MLSRHQLSPADLAGLIASVFAYNERGQVTAVIFYDDLGNPVKVGYAEAVCEMPGLKVRQAPEESPEDKLKRLAVGAETVTDPRSVPAPQSLNELAAAQNDVA